MQLEHRLSVLLQLHLHYRLNSGFNGLYKDNCKTRQETFKILDFVCTQYIYSRGLTFFQKISAKEGLSNVPESPAPSSTRTPATKPAVKPMMRRPAMRFTPVTAKSRPRPAATTVAETVAEPVAEVSIKTSTATTEETAVEKSQEPQIEKPVQAVCSEPEVPENTYTMGSASRDVSGRALEKIEESQTEETKSSQADECVTPEWPVVQPFSIMKSPSRFSEGKSGLSLGTGLKSPPPGLARVRSRFAKTKPNLTPRAR